MIMRSAQVLIALAACGIPALAYASASIATSSHLAGELFTMMAGVKIVHVPYKGAGPALIDIIAGQVQSWRAAWASPKCSSASQHSVPTR